MERAEEVIAPKLAAIEAEVFTQQVYQAIAKKLLAVDRQGERIFIRRKSFERWKANLKTRPRMRIEGKWEQEARA